MYASGARVSEACDLRWRDVQADGDAAVLAIFGKGGRDRAVRLTPGCYLQLLHLREDSAPADYVFRTKWGRMDVSTVWHVVRAAAKRAGITRNPSPHWLRHAAASHALNRGASLALVRDALGHSSVAITSVYLHARPAESLGQFLGI